MHRILNTLYVLSTIFFLFIPIGSNADSVGLGNPIANPNQNNVTVSQPTQTNVAGFNVNQDSGVATSANQHVMAAVGYHSLRQNLTTKEPIVIANETGASADCIESDGLLQSGGAFNQKTDCPPGYLPVAMNSTTTGEVAADSFRLTTAAKMALKKAALVVGILKVYYHLYCCKAHATYS